MGCLESTRQLSDEEKALIRGEREIGLSALSPITLETGFKRWLVPSGLSKERLNKALSSLNLQEITPDTPSGNRLFRLYARFRSGSCYDIQKLLIFSVLLSSGSVSQKSETWFDNLDIDLSGSISRDQFQRFLHVLIEANSVLLPEFSSGTNEGQIRPEKMEMYVKDWRKCEDEFIGNIVGLMFTRKENVTRETFVQEMNESFSKLTYCEGIRQMLQEFLSHVLAVSDRP